MEYEFLHLTIDGEIAQLQLNRPQRRNALHLAMLQELRAMLAELGQSKSRALVLLGAGPVFCSGHDFADLAGKSRDSIAKLVNTCTEVMLALRHLPIPSVAAVQGGALGAGCQLALTCDLIVAAENSYFQTPGGKGGWFCTTPGVAVARSLSQRQAAEMLLLGEPISAAQALSWGMINRVVPAAEVQTTAHALAAAAGRGSRASKAFGKQAFYRQCELVEEEAYRYASGAMIESAMHPDAQENFRAFVEKRAPKFGD